MVIESCLDVIHILIAAPQFVGGGGGPLHSLFVFKGISPSFFKFIDKISLRLRITRARLRRKEENPFCQNVETTILNVT